MPLVIPNKFLVHVSPYGNLIFITTGDVNMFLSVNRVCMPPARCNQTVPFSPISVVRAITAVKLVPGRKAVISTTSNVVPCWQTKGSPLIDASATRAANGKLNGCPLVFVLCDNQMLNAVDYRMNVGIPIVRVVQNSVFDSKRFIRKIMFELRVKANYNASTLWPISELD